MADNGKPRKTWWITREGITIDTIVAEEMVPKDGFVVFWTRGERVAVTALGGGTVLRCEEEAFSPIPPVR